MGGYNGRGIACNGPTMTFSPFWLASENKPYDPESYSRGWNYGAQLNFMVPLDREGLKQCKEIAKRQEEKMKLDYELEIAAIIGKKGKNISVDEADDYIMGYTIMNDLSARALQKKK